MFRHARTLSVAAALLALGGVFLAAARGRDDDDKEKAAKTAAARDAVLKLVARLGGKEDDVKKEAADIASKHDIEFVMNQFKPREKGGLGVGDKPDAITPDAVELMLLALASKKSLPPAQLASQKADLVKMAKVSEGIAFIAANYAGNEGRKGQEVKDWAKFCDEMRKGSKTLAAAIEGGDPKVVQAAAHTLNGSCNACHTAFRDK